MFSRIAIVAAMEREISFLRRAMSPPDDTGKRLVVGAVGARTVTLLRTGVGPLRTAQRLKEINQSCKPECVISVGCAGALSPRVGIGEVVIPEKLIDDSAGGKEYFSFPDLVKKAVACCGRLGIPSHLGYTVSTPTVAATPEDKKRLATKYGAFAVDMESAQVGAWAAASGLPMLTIRAISDTATDRIPPEVNTIVGPDERIRISEAMKLLVQRPMLLPELLRLKRNLYRSFASIEKVVTVLLRDM
ncbi:MAG: hypothetical protein HY801_01325 [Candidatus Lindowbacteria bacterium]|nr:hypothetical protein [Candidatus Lindowbacteria bacterium]